MSLTEWAPLHCHSWYSLLDGMADPRKSAAKAARLEYPALAMTDHGNVGGMVDHWKSCQKQGIKPIAGCEFYLCREDAAIKGVANTRPYSHLVVLAKNLKGWRQIIRAVSASNRQEHFYYHPRLQLDAFGDYAQGGDLIAFSGHPGSDLCNVIFQDPKAAYGCRDYDEVVSDHLKPETDLKRDLIAKAEQYLGIFGRENFFLEIQILNPLGMPASVAAAKALRWLAKRLKIRTLATADSHYVDRKDAYDQRILLCSKLRTTLRTIQRRIANDEDVELGGFFQGDHFHIPTIAEMQAHHRPEEIAQAAEIATMCEGFDILSQPRLPAFPCPPGHDPVSYLRDLCEEGFRTKLAARESGLEFTLDQYRDRLNMELGVINDAGLPSYFLIVQDVMHYGKSRGWLTGPARGSSAGSLVAYLSGITAIDPLPYGLLFERFYNAGRNAPGHISLPDIDMDFPAIKRDEAFRHMQGKYGVDHVAKIATFQTMQGRSAIDEVLSAHEIDFEQRKLITQVIPDKARISEELQAMVERGEDPSIIRYTLETFGDELADHVQLQDDGTLTGDYAGYFEQAIRLEGTKKNISTHAAGVVISATPLAEVCPLRWDDGSSCWVAAMEYPALEAMGLVKLDLLGITMLNKGEGVRDLARTGRITPLA